MFSYKLIIQYDGTRYNGFQRQTVSSHSKTEKIPKRPRYNEFGHKKKHNIFTVQDALEDAFRLYLPYEISTSQLRLRVAGRTDKGVHARGQVIAVDLLQQLQDPEWKIIKSLNSRLPIDVSVSSCCTCAPTFQPRLNVTLKQYSYTMRYRKLVLDDNGEPLPACNAGPYSIQTAFDSPILWKCPWSLDESKLESTCRFLLGRHDFSSFVHKDNRNQRDKRCNNSDDDNKVCNIVTLERFDFVILDRSNLEEEAPWVEVKFRMEAKGFRRSMCRNLVGFVVEVCRGEVSEDLISRCWEDPSLICSAPASGLCLEHVTY